MPKIKVKVIAQDIPIAQFLDVHADPWSRIWLGIVGLGHGVVLGMSLSTGLFGVGVGSWYLFTSTYGIGGNLQDLV